MLLLRIPRSRLLKRTYSLPDVQSYLPHVRLRRQLSLASPLVVAFLKVIPSSGPKHCSADDSVMGIVVDRFVVTSNLSW